MSFWNFLGWGTTTTRPNASTQITYDADPLTNEEETVVQATTANGAASYATTGDPRLDLFGKVCRDTPKEALEDMLDKSWDVNPLDTLKLIFYIRDCRGGSGERKQFFWAVQWLQRKNVGSLIYNMCHVPFYGRYKDFLEIAATADNTVVSNVAYSCLAYQLSCDRSRLGGADAHKITLAGKYAPSENGYYDKRCGAVSEMCKFLCCDKKTYRKEYLTPLRKAANVVETKMTNNPEDWHSINFSHVPSIALKKYKKAWERHEAGRFNTWLEAVKAGTVKMNVLRLMPHQIVEPYFDIHRHLLNFGFPDHLVEMQWAAFLDQTRSNLVKSETSLKVVSVIDTSASMSNGCNPSSLTVALSLGLALAELTEGPYKGRFVTFSEEPTVETIKGDSLLEKLQNMSQAKWMQNTNIQAVYDLLLGDQEDVDTVFVFSDMQWDKVRGENVTNWVALNEKYAAKGRKRPRFVFWNLSGSTFDFPVPSAEENACYISGFSMDVLKAILRGSDLSPIDLMLSVIRSERYSRIVFPKVENDGIISDDTE